MNSLMQDVRYALRQLRKSPGFTLTVILTLALGIGANAAVFTLFDQVLLRMLPVQQPQNLVRFEWSGGFSGSMSSFGGDSDNYFSYPAYKELRDHNQVFDGVLAADKAQVGISWHNQAENDDAEIVSGNYFQVLGLQPALQRRAAHHRHRPADRARAAGRGPHRRPRSDRLQRFSWSRSGHSRGSVRGGARGARRPLYDRAHALLSIGGWRYLSSPHRRNSTEA